MFKVDLSDKVIAITGAGGIICSEFAKSLAENGAKVALLDINYDAAKKYADEIGENALAVKCNCLDKESIKSAKEEQMVMKASGNIIASRAARKRVVNSTKELRIFCKNCGLKVSKDRITVPGYRAL